MWVCLDCLETFESPKHYTETHGLDCGPYEQWSGCPYCAGAFVEAHKCDCCGEWITEHYIKTDDGHRFCDNCYNRYDLGEENF